MAFLIKKGRNVVSLTPKHSTFLYNVVRTAVNNKDYLPGSYPTTPEMRRAAAKKYGLHEDEYESYSLDESCGDYPKLPDIGADSKDPYYPYDYPVYRRNFNEPVHRFFHLYGEERFDPAEKTYYNKWIYTLISLSSFAIMCGITHFTENIRVDRPVTEKQFPSENTVHYTFQPLR